MKFILNILMISILLISCSEEQSGDSFKLSKHFTDRSHNEGTNCMSCHKSGGDGEGWFTAAGTLYKQGFVETFPNATIYLLKSLHANADTVAKIEVDARGNFYTTEKIDFTSGLNPMVVSQNGNFMRMGSLISNGACGSCHGSANDKIWLKQ